MGVITLAGFGLLGLLGLAGCLIYLLPWIMAQEVASAKRRRIILGLNILLGWTVIGWVAAVVLALSWA